jgi:hypothetical protein
MKMLADHLVLLHLHKTGGSTIHKLLEQCLPPARLAPKNRTGIPNPALCMMYPVISGHVTAHFIRSLSGNPRVFTLLREPRERLLSQIYFLKSYTLEHLETYDNPVALHIKKTPIKELLRRGEQMDWARDYYVKRLDPLFDAAKPESNTPNVDRATAFLRGCIVVGVSSQLEAFVRAALPYFGVSTDVQVPVVNRRQDLEITPGFEPVKLETISDKEEAVINDLTRNDRELYTHALNVAPQ